MLMREKEIDGIETVGDLRSALADVPDEMPLKDCFDEPLMASLYQDKETGDQHVTTR
jgi:hypothetical protein